MSTEERMLRTLDQFRLLVLRILRLTFINGLCLIEEGMLSLLAHHVTRDPLHQNQEPQLAPHAH